MCNDGLCSSTNLPQSLLLALVPPRSGLYGITEPSLILSRNHCRCLAVLSKIHKPKQDVLVLTQAFVDETNNTGGSC